MSIEYLLDLQEKIPNSELEYRVRILPIDGFVPDYTTTIVYYRSMVYPSVTFRKYLGEREIETKETVEKFENYYLSVEKKYRRFDIKIPLIEYNRRTICRKRICENPIADITKHNSEFQLEIEFNRSNYHLIHDIIDEYKVPYYPMVKPMEIPIRELANIIFNRDQLFVSFKADGIHTLVLQKGDDIVLVHENGYINGPMIDYDTVYEAELMGDGELLYFDCHLYKNEAVHTLPYGQRIEYIETSKRKDIWSMTEIDKVMYYIPKHKADGFIITDNNQVYKSKFIPTVDLKYKNGYLLLENELMSTRIPKTNFTFQNNKIYEFDMELNLIRPRKDKVTANYRFPNEENPLYKIVSGYGIYNLRIYHNLIKNELLDKLPNQVHVDIGSGKGGDINKWTKFKKVYAVDPCLDLRHHKDSIVEVKSTAIDLPEYNSISIFFVPWDDSFIDLINKAEYCALILMANPFNYKCDQFECTVNDDEIELRIPHTSTAEYVKEKVVQENKIFKELSDWKITEINQPCNLSEPEQILKSMYKYYYLEKKK